MVVVVVVVVVAVTMFGSPETEVNILVFCCYPILSDMSMFGRLGL